MTMPDDADHPHRADHPDPQYMDTAGRTWCCCVCLQPLPLSAVQRGVYTCQSCQTVDRMTTTTSRHELYLSEFLLLYVQIHQPVELFSPHTWSAKHV